MRPGSEVSGEVGSRRDRGLTALILGFFAIGWFSWGEVAASGAVRTALTAGSIAAVAVTLLGAVSICRSRRMSGVMHDPATRRRYGIVVATEFALAGLGAGALGLIGAGGYIPAWICGVVGLHFFPLAAVLGAPALRVLGAAVTSAAVAALLAGLFTPTAPSSVAGPGAGVALLVFAALVVRGPASRRSIRGGNQQPSA